MLQAYKNGISKDPEGEDLIGERCFEASHKLRCSTGPAKSLASNLFTLPPVDSTRNDSCSNDFETRDPHLTLQTDAHYSVPMS
jgi:hypothetical protein